MLCFAEPATWREIEACRVDLRNVKARIIAHARAAVLIARATHFAREEKSRGIQRLYRNESALLRGQCMCTAIRYVHRLSLATSRDVTLFTLFACRLIAITRYFAGNFVGACVRLAGSLLDRGHAYYRHTHRHRQSIDQIMIG
jgi:hypothetical protein